jgi:hypothetical protein
MKNTLLILIFFVCIQTQAQILSEKDQAIVRDEILNERLNNLLPILMDRGDIDMWVLISREYNEDPVMRTMLPSKWLAARRRTILVFYRDKENDVLEKMSVSTYYVGKLIKNSWDKSVFTNQWDALKNLIVKYDPDKIGLNYSDNYGIADGIAHTDYREFMNMLPEEYKSKVVSAEKLAISWIETRTEKEMVYFRQLVNITHNVISEAFSNKVINPGSSTTEDVKWWIRDKITALGLKPWFHPSIDIQRSDIALEGFMEVFSKDKVDEIIMSGDLLHCDVGITYLGLNSDIQEHAYVLKENETEIPEFLISAFKKGNRLQDIFTANFKTGITGNKILLKSLADAKAEGLAPSIYSHPLGYYGHSAGTVFGMWDQQGGVPGTGDYPLFENTAYAIELNVSVNIPEWNRKIRIMLEEDGIWSKNKLSYINGRQLEMYKIKSK